MLTITVKETEFYNEASNEFIKVPSTELQLEHSLLSLSKWESKWNKPFLSKDDRTFEETLDYIRCMTINKNVNPIVYTALSNENVQAVIDYIKAPATATWFSEDKEARPSREVITSELIYYWMIALNIPFECEKWHLNRLMTLVRVCNVKNAAPKKQSPKSNANRRSALNAQRRAALNSRG